MTTPTHDDWLAAKRKAEAAAETACIYLRKGDIRAAEKWANVNDKWRGRMVEINSAIEAAAKENARA